MYLYLGMYLQWSSGWKAGAGVVFTNLQLELSDLKLCVHGSFPYMSTCRYSVSRLCTVSSMSFLHGSSISHLSPFSQKVFCRTLLFRSLCISNMALVFPSRSLGFWEHGVAPYLFFNLLNMHMLSYVPMKAQNM